MELIFMRLLLECEMVSDTLFCQFIALVKVS